MFFFVGDPAVAECPPPLDFSTHYDPMTDHKMGESGSEMAGPALVRCHMLIMPSPHPVLHLYPHPLPLTHCRGLGARSLPIPDGWNLLGQHKSGLFQALNRPPRTGIASNGQAGAWTNWHQARRDGKWRWAFTRAIKGQTPAFDIGNTAGNWDRQWESRRGSERKIQSAKLQVPAFEGPKRQLGWQGWG